MLADSIWTIVALQAVVCGAIGAAIGSGKGQAGSGFVLGLLFGVLGLIIIAVSGDSAALAAKKEREHREQMAAMLGVARTAASPDVEGQLRMIEDLARRGQISDEERAEARRNVLANAQSAPALPAMVSTAPEEPTTPYKAPMWPYWLVGGVVLLVIIAIGAAASGGR